MNTRYVVKGKIGAGGLGEVYLATDTQLDRDVALKRVKPPESGSAEALHADLIREAASKGALGPANHPQVIRLRTIAQRLIPFVAVFVDAVSLPERRITVDWGLDY